MIRANGARGSAGLPGERLAGATSEAYRDDFGFNDIPKPPQIAPVDALAVIQIRKHGRVVAKKPAVDVVFDWSWVALIVGLRTSKRTVSFQRCSERRE